jgi:hypothetical protein
LFCYVNRPEIFLWKFRFSFGWKKRRLNDVILLLLFREGTRYHFSVRSGCMPIVLWMGQRDVHIPTGFDYITRNGRNIRFPAQKFQWTTTPPRKVINIHGTIQERMISLFKFNRLVYNRYTGTRTSQMFAFWMRLTEMICGLVIRQFLPLLISFWFPSSSLC